jgi:hypothetical protein
MTSWASSHYGDPCRECGFESLSLPGVQWSVAQAAADWLVAVNEAADDLAMEHGERGRQTLHDVVLSNAHDVAHHTWDIRRSLSHDPPA